MPAPQTKQRTISYIRASWAREPLVSLEEALKRALRAMPHSADTQLPLRDMHAEVRHRDLAPRWVQLHVAAWTDGGSASIVPHARPGAEADLDELVPEEDWDYLDGDGMILVSDMHCLLMPSGLHPKSIERYMQLLLAHARYAYGADIPEHIESFELVPVANDNVVRQIRREGVKKFHLNLGQYLETARAGHDEHMTIVERLGRGIFESLLTREEDRRKIEEADNVQAKLVITCDGRRAGIEPDDLTPIARAIADESGDDIFIETGTGQQIKRGQVVLKKPVDVAIFAKTVHHRDAWDRMAMYFDELREGGMLEE